MCAAGGSCRTRCATEDPLAIAASDAHFRAAFPPLLEVAGPLERIFVQIPEGIYKSFWYVSGWNQFSWRWFWYLPFWLLAGVGLVDLTRLGRSSQARPGAREGGVAGALRGRDRRGGDRVGAR